MVCANPRCSGHHRQSTDRHGDDTPSKNDLGGVFHDVVLEGADDEEDEPGDTGCRTARVDTTDVLQETCPEDAHPERSPLEMRCQLASCAKCGERNVPFGRS